MGQAISLPFITRTRAYTRWNLDTRLPADSQV
jgi:hypothetical protein